MPFSKCDALRGSEASALPAQRAELRAPEANGFQLIDYFHDNDLDSFKKMLLNTDDLSYALNGEEELLIDTLSNTCYERNDEFFKAFVETIKPSVTKEYFDKHIFLDIYYNDYKCGEIFLDAFPEFVDQDVLDDIYYWYAWYIGRWNCFNPVTREMIEEEKEFYNGLLALKKRGAKMIYPNDDPECDDVARVLKQLDDFVKADLQLL